jgi:hypothetical protein
MSLQKSFENILEISDVTHATFCDFSRFATLKHKEQPLVIDFDNGKIHSVCSSDLSYVTVIKHEKHEYLIAYALNNGNISFETISQSKVKELSLCDKVLAIRSNGRVVGIAKSGLTFVYDSEFEELFSVSTGSHVFDINSRWLAFNLCPQQAITATRTQSHVLSYWDTAYEYITGKLVSPNLSKEASPAIRAGIIAFRQLKDGKIIGFFEAHKEEVGTIVFDNTGGLIVSFSDLGQRAFVHRAVRDSANEDYISFHHIHTLVRGITPATILNMSWSCDSTRVSLCSEHGTVHIFELGPEQEVKPIFRIKVPDDLIEKPTNTVRFSSAQEFIILYDGGSLRQISFEKDMIIKGDHLATYIQRVIPQQSIHSNTAYQSFRSISKHNGDIPRTWKSAILHFKKARVLDGGKCKFSITEEPIALNKSRSTQTNIQLMAADLPKLLEGLSHRLDIAGRTEIDGYIEI